MKQFLKKIEQDRDLAGTVRHHELLPASEAKYGELSKPLPDPILRGLGKLGISDLYSHQTEAITELRNGKSIVVVTPTASGKTLTHLLPIAESFLADPDGSALLIYPLKALEQDQLSAIRQWIEWLKPDADLTAEIFDGDTPQNLRSKIKKRPPNFLLTNPDMLHQGTLAYHQAWEPLLRRLKYIVIDELHAYRGVFGSHISQVFRRLFRLLSYYDVNPQIVCLSATIANPQELAESLSGRKFYVIQESGAPAVEKSFYLLQPNASLNSTAAKLFVHAIESGLKTIVFTKARVSTEIIYRSVMEIRPELAAKVSSYRAGFLPEERRDIEHKLSSGVLSGVISTSALELGIDIGGLDLCILAGYPGSIMSTWQRAGRVGRRGKPCAIVMIGGTDALDQYFLANPQELFNRKFESALINDSNEEILRQHLPAAASEIPLMMNDPHYDLSKYSAIMERLEHDGHLVRAATGKQWFPGRNRPQREVNLRNAGGTFDIVINRGKESQAIGQISGSSVFRECHEGAVYLHRGEQFFVKQLDLERKRVVVEPFHGSIYTMVRSDKETEILDVQRESSVHSFVVRYGTVRVTESYSGYERRRLYSQELLSVEPLDLPPQSFTTKSAWIELPATFGDVLKKEELHFMGGIHALEHAMISLIPLTALCDRNDIGGISFTRHKQIEDGAVFFYDGYPGGAGIADHVYHVIKDLLNRTRDLISNCACLEGCPSCIHSPKCGSGNKPLDKQAAIRSLDILLSDMFVPLSIESILIAEESESPSTELPPWIPQEIPADKRFVVFDLETQLSADEVGGWSEARQMRVAVAVVWDSLDNEITIYDESQVDKLMEHLKSADCIVGYNVVRFDYEVLRGYTFENLRKLPTLDLLQEVTKARGGRLKLDSIAKATLGSSKSADGLQSIAWFKAGEFDKVAEYCKRDVEITRDVLLYALRNGHVLYEHSKGAAVRLPLKLSLGKFIESTDIAA